MPPQSWRSSTTRRAARSSPAQSQTVPSLPTSRETLMTEDFEGRIDDARFPLLVADAGQEVIGWAGLASYSSRPCYAGIAECSVYVAVEARGRGVGTSLTEALAGAALSNDFHKLIGKLFTDNTASIRLVERCGFSSVGLHRRHGQLDGAWRDVLVVKRLLDEDGDA
ncbi:MAG: N-acetyltransferase [Solirubrobacterales bacterium]|nr:N-acetyltransferase [Solirubrobacterales bacterium]